MMLQQIVNVGQQMRVAIGETDAAVAVDGIQGRLLQFHTLSPLLLLLLIILVVVIVAVIQCAIRAATVAATALA